MNAKQASEIRAGLKLAQKDADAVISSVWRKRNRLEQSLTATEQDEAYSTTQWRERHLKGLTRKAYGRKARRLYRARFGKSMYVDYPFF